MFQLRNKKKAAAMLGVSPHSITRLMRDGLEFVRVGSRQIRFRDEDILAYIEKKRNCPDSMNHAANRRKSNY